MVPGTVLKLYRYNMWCIENTCALLYASTIRTCCNTVFDTKYSIYRLPGSQHDFAFDYSHSCKNLVDACAYTICIYHLYTSTLAVLVQVIFCAGILCVSV